MLKGSRFVFHAMLFTVLAFATPTTTTSSDLESKYSNLFPNALYAQIASAPAATQADDYKASSANQLSFNLLAILLLQ